MRRTIFALGLSVITLSCKPRSIADEVNADGPASSAAAITVPAATAAPTANGQVSLIGLLARNGVAGVHLALVPLVPQARDFTSGAAALQAVLALWGETFREGQLAQLLPANPTSGVDCKAMVSFVQSLNDPKRRSQLVAAPAEGESGTGAGVVHRWRPAAVTPGSYIIDLHPGESTRMRKASEAGEGGVPKDGISITELQNLINKGWPVIVRLQAWSAAATPAYNDDNSDGHYAVVVGYNKSSIFFMDPATSGNYTYIPTPEFEARWHDAEGKQNFRHFALVIHRNQPAFDFDNVLKLE